MSSSIASARADTRHRCWSRSRAPPAYTDGCGASSCGSSDCSKALCSQHSRVLSAHKVVVNGTLIGFIPLLCVVAYHGDTNNLSTNSGQHFSIFPYIFTGKTVLVSDLYDISGIALKTIVPYYWTSSDLNSSSLYRPTWGPARSGSTIRLSCHTLWKGASAPGIICVNCHSKFINFSD
jgi:hypothetical protein